MQRRSFLLTALSPVLAIKQEFKKSATIVQHSLTDYELQWLNKDGTWHVIHDPQYTLNDLMRMQEFYMFSDWAGQASIGQLSEEHDPGDPVNIRNQTLETINANDYALVMARREVMAGSIGPGPR